VSVFAWRIVQRRFVKGVFSGDAARRFGGRWNSPGHAVVYTAQSLALAALEILVHLDSEKVLRNFVAIPVTLQEKFIASLDATRLPRTWRAYPATKFTRFLGDAWIAEGKSAVFRVSSAVIPAESNFLLNPIHPDFDQLTIGDPVPFKFDSRLTG
jgi:RES domain-containing protein